MYCPYCRQQLKETDRFCTRCGKCLPVAVPVPRPPAPTPSVPVSVGETPVAVPEAPVAKAAPAPVVPGSPVPVVLAVVACLLALASVAVLLLAPLASVTPVADGSGLLLSAAARFDGAFAAAAGPWLGQQALTAVPLAELVLSYADEGANVPVAVGTGCLLGVAAAFALLLAAGIVSIALRRRPTGLLVAGCVGTTLVSAALLAGVFAIDLMWTPRLKAAVGALYGGVGPQVAVPDHMAAATPWLVVAVVLAAAAWCVAVAARRRWAIEHPRLG